LKKEKKNRRRKKNSYLQNPIKSYNNGMQKKIHNIPETAKILGVHEMTIRYWIKKKWISVQYDYRNYPVFTDEDIKRIEQWRNTLRKP